MCKVLMLSNANKVVNVKKLADTVFDLITKVDDDGFGYAFKGYNGVFGEKTINRTWKYGSKTPEFAKAFVTEEKFGTEGKINGPALFHGRTSTNAINLLNTHPLQKAGWTLIHNGVVNNRGPDYVQHTTNDTEHLLHYLTTTGISGIENYITGYYAVGAIDPDGKLHVIRDNIAPLYVCFSDTIKSYIFATTVDLITKLCIEMQWARGTIREYDKAIYTVFSKNNAESITTFQPRGYGYQESQYASRSIGRSIGTGYGGSYEDYAYGHKHRRAGPATVWVGGEQTTAEDDVSEADSELSDEQLESYQAFVEEIGNMDSSYMIEDENGRELSLREFDKLDLIHQSRCKIIRADGTVVDPDDYYTPRMA